MSGFIGPLRPPGPKPHFSSESHLWLTTTLLLFSSAAPPDIGFIDGFHFLSMEILDGEDVAQDDQGSNSG
jgi:hypothetical protein